MWPGFGSGPSLPAHERRESCAAAVASSVWRAWALGWRHEFYMYRGFLSVGSYIVAPVDQLEGRLPEAHDIRQIMGRNAIKDPCVLSGAPEALQVFCCLDHTFRIVLKPFLE